VQASEEKANRYRDGSAKGTQIWLTTAVIKHGQAAPASSSSLGTMAAWPTPNCMDVITPTRDLTQMESKGHWGKGMNTGKLSEMVNYGQAAPASSSSLGSRQGLWLTPRANEPTGDSTFVTRNGDRGQHCSPSLTIQVESPETWALRQAKGDVATMPLTAQVKQWATPQAHDAQGPKTPEQIEAMRAKGHGVKNLNEQAQWGTPTARDHKSGRGNEVREYKELTPMVERQQSGKLNPRWVETLMGLPIGWTMPSCIRPVTTAPTSCDSSGMALCQPSQSEPSDFLLASCGNWTTPNQVDATIEKGALRPSRIATGRKTDYLARQVQMQLK
jgi:hypothetical protein